MKGSRDKMGARSSMRWERFFIGVSHIARRQKRDKSIESRGLGLLGRISCMDGSVLEQVVTTAKVLVTSRVRALEGCINEKSHS